MCIRDRRQTLLDLATQLDPTDPLSQGQRDAALEALRKAGYQGDMYDAKGLAAFLRGLADLEDAGGEAGAALRKFIDTFTGVFDEVARIAEERAGLEMRLLELTGTDAEILAAKRQLELDAIDATNRALLKRIYAPVSYTHLDVYKRQLLSEPTPALPSRALSWEHQARSPPGPRWAVSSLASAPSSAPSSAALLVAALAPSSVVTRSPTLVPSPPSPTATSSC